MCAKNRAFALPADFEERWKINAAPTELEVGTPETSLERTDNSIERYNVDAIVADGCFLDRSKIENALTLLERKKNLVLQGPPGTGKTWLAKRLGYALIGEKDPSRLLAVQFQPSLSYEDFVRGCRPNGSGGLQLADGVFLEAVASANDDPKRPYVLVIEEINRGNPAQILGELLTLLEADKRKESEALRLAYPRTLTERVYVPPNLYVVGTMNLADRSLALVDLALRRRFAFVTLKPNFETLWMQWCQALGAPDGLLERVSQAVVALNRSIEEDKSLGPQFGVGHSFLTPPDKLAGASLEVWKSWFSDVINTEIEPLLLEYWYDNKDRAKKQIARLNGSL